MPMDRVRTFNEVCRLLGYWGHLNLAGEAFIDHPSWQKPHYFDGRRLYDCKNYLDIKELIETELAIQKIKS